MFRRYFLPWIVWTLYRVWSATWRIQVIESEGMQRSLALGEPLILSHWHGDEIGLLPQVKHYELAAMTSTSKDGQLIDFVIRKFGGVTSKGSSTRGGATALKGLVRLMKSGHISCMAVDGPKGPLHVPKAGVFELSRLAHAKIVPVGIACSKAIQFKKSWNKTYLPYPFAKLVVLFLEPWQPITRDDDARGSELSGKLAKDISSACQCANEKLR